MLITRLPSKIPHKITERKVSMFSLRNPLLAPIPRLFYTTFLKSTSGISEYRLEVHHPVLVGYGYPLFWPKEAVSGPGTFLANFCNCRTATMVVTPSVTRTSSRVV